MSYNETGIHVVTCSCHREVPCEAVSGSEAVKISFACYKTGIYVIIRLCHAEVHREAAIVMRNTTFSKFTCNMGSCFLVDR